MVKVDLTEHTFSSVLEHLTKYSCNNHKMLHAHLGYTIKYHP